MSIISSLFSTLVSKVAPSVISAVATPFLSNIKIILIGVALSVVATLSGSLWYYKSKYETEIKTVGELTTKVNTVSDQLGTCNGNIQSISDETTAKLKESKAALEKAQDLVKKYRTYADSILVAKPVSQDVCVSSKALFTQYLTTLKGESK